MSENSVRRKFLHHIDIRCYFVCQLVTADFSNSSLSAHVNLPPTPHQEPTLARFHQPLPCHDGPKTLFALQFLHSEF